MAKKEGMKFVVTVTNAGTVADLDKRTDLSFVSDSQDVKAIKEEFGNHYKVREFDSFFVKVGEGEYEEVYGISGIIPDLDKPVSKIEGKLVPR